MPVLQNVRERGRQVQCVGAMRQIGLAFRTYQNEHKGMYPEVARSATENWETFLADPSLGGVYISGSLLGPDGAGQTKFKTSFLCPTTVKRPDFTAYGEYWGYSINNSRTDISYHAGGPPWNDLSYQDADLDELYKQGSEAAVLIDGNQRHFGGGGWDAFLPGGWWDWTVVPIHRDGINVLFLDGHIAFMKTTTPEDQTRINQVMYGGIPATGNPW